MQTLMHILKFFWRGIGKPGAVLVLMGVVTVTDAIAPGTVGHFWFGLLLLTFYLSSIAETLDKILQKLSTKQE